MNLLEIKNNLVKLSYNESEKPVLGRFVVLVNSDKSYVAQFVNLKSDTVNKFAIAKLLFTFSAEGVVDNYDGSIPSMNSELSFLSSQELLNLLPLEIPVKIGNLAQSEEILELDISMFERNFTLFSDKIEDSRIFISNCVRQLFQMKEKSVIIDNCNMFEDYPKVTLGKDFKLPLNSMMIDYLFEYELSEVNAETKAIIQDIFYAVQQYIKSLDFEFLPIDNFINVVENQYKETQMPELALLKNKLLKYRDANVFANTKEEVLALDEKLNEKNCTIIDLKDIHDSLQKEVFSIIHSALDKIEKYIYLFVPLNDDNSDKKLLKQFINHNHIFSTLIVNTSYKYASELKQYAQNMILFAPQNVNNDFAVYNTFLNKLNQDECIVCGKLTQGIPFIVEMAELDTDLTQDDVLGEKFQFVPITEDLQLIKVGENGERIPVEMVYKSEEQINDDEISQAVTEDTEIAEDEPLSEEIPLELQEETTVQEQTPELEELPEIQELEGSEIIEPEILTEEPLEIEEDLSQNILEEPEIQEEQLAQDSTADYTESIITEPEPETEVLTEEDLDFLEGDSQIAAPDDFFGEDLPDEETMEESFSEPEFEQEQPPVVPIYTSEEPESQEIEAGEFVQGDTVTHPRYGRGVVEKIIKYGNKTLCSISFENVGRRLLDPTISELNKI